MDLGIKNKIALVLASSKGLGQAIAFALAKEGAYVVVTGRSQADVESTVAIIKAAGGKAYPLLWDLYDLSLIDSRVSEIEAQVGEIDILVNNTGGPPPTPAANQPVELWLENFNNLVLSVIQITDRILPGMRKRGWGRIITSTSSGIVAPIPNLAISNALRASLMGWSKTLASEVAPDGVTVNVVIPGRIATNRLKQLDENRAQRENISYEQACQLSIASIPMARYGEAEEYGNIVAMLASTQTSYMTGTLVRVDGGAMTGH